MPKKNGGLDSAQERRNEKKHFYGFSGIFCVWD